MSTNPTFIAACKQKILPREVLHMTSVDGTGKLVALSNDSLRRQVEWFVCQRHLTWEEWLDMRDAWCRAHRVVVCSTTRGDTQAVKRTAEQGERQGYQYILLDYVS